MKIVVVGHGMVGHKFLESLAEAGLKDAEVTVLCEEPRPAYDRVHLSEYFSGKSAEDLSVVESGFFERTGFKLRLAAKAVAIERRTNTVTTADGEPLVYAKLVLAPCPSCHPSPAASATSALSTAPLKTSMP
jgi:nitrite reductase (NADH) large subunit